MQVSRRPNAKQWIVPEQIVECPMSGTAVQFEVDSKGRMVVMFYTQDGVKCSYEFLSNGHPVGTMVTLGRNRPGWPVPLDQFDTLTDSPAS